MSKVIQAHDDLVEKIVPAILTVPLEAGGDVADVMAVLASVVVGVVSVCANYDKQHDAYPIFLAEIERRLAEQRMGKPQGTA